MARPASAKEFKIEPFVLYSQNMLPQRAHSDSAQQWWLRYLSATQSAGTFTYHICDVVRERLKEYFTEREDVMAIYFVDKRSHYQAIVITNHEQYHREAMHALFECEYELMQQIGDIPLEIDYIPRLDRDFEDIVPTAATLIFRR